VFIWTTLIYDPLAHWVWSWTLNDDYELVPLGWLNQLGALDFAGGTVIHVSSGSSALAAALVLGKRKNSQDVKAHNVPMVVMGGTLLWFGWFGFNAGSANAANGVSTIAFVNTHLATCCASLSWMLTEVAVGRAPSATGAAAGAVAGLVAITPACGFIEIWAGLITGFIVSPICYGGVWLKGKIGYDDTLDSFAVHAIGGAVGAICTGLFSTAGVNPGIPNQYGAFYGNGIQLGYQLAAIMTSFTFCFVGTIIIMVILKYTIGIRISEEAEELGIDVSEHGGAAYQGKD